MNYPVWKSNGKEKVLVHDMVQDAMLGADYKAIEPEAKAEKKPRNDRS